MYKIIAKATLPEWLDKMTDKQRKAYFEKHPNSKYNPNRQKKTDDKPKSKTKKAKGKATLKNLTSKDSVYRDKKDLRPDTTKRQLETGEAAIKDLNKKILGLKAANRGVSLLGLAINREIVSQGNSLLIGKVVKNPADLAVISQVYRDQRFETFRIIYVSDKKEVVGETAITSRAPGYVSFGSSYAIKDQIQRGKKRFGANSYYIMHNHPSGNSSPSSADIHVTELINSEVPGLLEHIIINSNEYTVIKPAGNYRDAVTKIDKHTLDIEQLPNTPTLEHSILGTMIDSPNALVSAVKSLPNNNPVLVATSMRGDIRLLADIPVDLLSELKKDYIEFDKARKDQVNRLEEGEQTNPENMKFIRNYNKRTKILSYWLRKVTRESGTANTFLTVSIEDMRANKYFYENLMYRGLLIDVVSDTGVSIANTMGTSGKSVWDSTPEKVYNLED